MATIIANGCFDLLHEGHQTFLRLAKNLGCQSNHLVVAVNTDASAQHLKITKWGEKYPIDDLTTRCQKLCAFADEVVSFDTEEELHGLIEFLSPCIIVKGPDYADKWVTGQDIAPLIILDVPEPESVKALKIQVYGQHPNESCSAGKI